jgi:hypothetical protein
VPDWDSTERSDSDEDAAWRDLVARFDSPVAAQEPAPWPDRENTSSAPEGSDGASVAAGSGPESSGPGGEVPPKGGVPPKTVIISASPAVPVSPPELDEHFVPEPPPPLPKLDPMAKGAWLALFGGPGYLLLATALGWTIPGIAVFCAVAAFVGGVALLVFRLNDSDRDDSDDDGAVV